MDIGPLSAPYLLAPILAMAQQVNVSRPGEQPDPAQPIPEDMCLFDPALVGANGAAAVLCCSPWTVATGLLASVSSFLFGCTSDLHIRLCRCIEVSTLLNPRLSGQRQSCRFAPSDAQTC